MKKILVLLLALCILCACVGCGGKSSDPLSFLNDHESESQETESTTEETEEPTTTEPPTTTEEPTTTEPEVTEPTTAALPSDPCLRMYQELINDYASILRTCYASSQWSGASSLPTLSGTTQSLIAQLGELKYEWENMLYELKAPGMGTEAFGYILYDLNADDVPELFWVRNDHTILAIFTYYNNSVCLLRGCWSRSSCYLAQNNTLYRWGSAGATDNFCSSYVLYNGELFEGFRFYSEGNGSTVNYYETSATELMWISEERFEELCISYPYENSHMWCMMPVQPLTLGVENASVASSSNEGLLPYLQKVHRPDQSIRSGPGYDYSFVGTVELAGIYTVTAEVRDYEGNLWGRLKSGVGWIDLSQIRYEDYHMPIISANFADQTLISSGNYHYYEGESAQYAVRIAFRAYENLSEVRLYRGEYEMAEELLYLAQWSPNKPIVADLSFPGDFSTYCISFIDSSGVYHVYTLMRSGRNGDVELHETNPW